MAAAKVKKHIQGWINPKSSYFLWAITPSKKFQGNPWNSCSSHHLVILDMEFPYCIPQCWTQGNCYFTCNFCGDAPYSMYIWFLHRQQLLPQLTYTIKSGLSDTGTMWLDYCRWASWPSAVCTAIMWVSLLHHDTPLWPHLCGCVGVPSLLSKPTRKPVLICK